jgi:hypothetical protein
MVPETLGDGLSTFGDFTSHVEAEMLKIWHIKRLTEVGYDEYDAFVVIAETAGKARKLANEEECREGDRIWANPELASCAELKAEGEPRVVLGSFNAG